MPFASSGLEQLYQLLACVVPVLEVAELAIAFATLTLVCSVATEPCLRPFSFLSPLSGCGTIDINLVMRFSSLGEFSAKKRSIGVRSLNGLQRSSVRSQPPTITLHYILFISARNLELWEYRGEYVMYRNGEQIRVVYTVVTWPGSSWTYRTVLNLMNSGSGSTIRVAVIVQSC